MGLRSLWRISNRKSLTGEGGLHYAARWHHAGRRIVYLAESPPGALVEVLVHLEIRDGDLPAAYTLLQVGVPEDLAIEKIPVPSGEAWRTDLQLSRTLGDNWLLQAATALARVPSAILPETFNILLNPAHPDAGRVSILSSTHVQFDPRLKSHLRG